MSSTSFELGPFLASDLPPVVAGRRSPGLRDRLVARWQERRFERALRHACHSEQADLLALARRG
jgi:hypothetical protein